MRLLAAGVASADIATKLSSAPEVGSALTVDDLRAIAARAAVLVGAQELSPPAAAGFLQTRPFAVTRLGQAQSRAVELLRGYAESPDLDRLVERGAPRETSDRVALEYAEAVLIQDQALAERSSSPLRQALPDDDRGRVDELVLWGSMHGPQKSLEFWLHSWERLAERLARDDGSLLYEEHEDKLSSRDSLERALLLVTPASRELLEADVRVIDERFLQATRSVSSSICPPSPWAPQGWWWHRVPSTLGEHFQDRLRHVAPAVAEEVAGFRRPDGLG